MVFGLCRWVIDWGHSGSTMPDSGGVCNTPLHLRFPFFVRQGRGATAYASSDVPVKGTNAGARLFRRGIYWDQSGPIVPVWRAYAIRPYVSGFSFFGR